MIKKERSNIILNLYKAKEKILNFLENKDEYFVDKYKHFLYNNLKELKRIECTKIRSEIELEIKKETKYPAFDYQSRLVSLHNIIAVMLGVIDARSDDNKRYLKFNNIFNSDTKISEINNRQKKLDEYRNKIINDYLITMPREELQIIKQTLETKPSYKNFNNLFNNLKDNYNQLSIQGEVISAYMFGYNHSLYFYPEEIMPYYNEIMFKYKKIKFKNKNNLEKVKLLVKKDKR